MRVILKPTSVLKKGLHIEEGGKVHRFFTNTCALRMDKYTPFDTGSLAETVVINNHVNTQNVTVDTITYNQKYAEYVYTGNNIKNYHTDKHRLAGRYWDKRMLTAEKTKINKEVQDYMEKIK